jgi:predicted  nucleic acid-binding Zn-ribbon protein
MNCKYCDTVHPQEEFANPHYCIARMEEAKEKLEDEIERLTAEIERLKKSAEMLRMHLGNEKHEVGRLSRMLERKYRE